MTPFLGCRSCDGVSNMRTHASSKFHFALGETEAQRGKGTCSKSWALVWLQSLSLPHHAESPSREDMRKADAMSLASVPWPGGLPKHWPWSLSGLLRLFPGTGSVVPSPTPLLCRTPSHLLTCPRFTEKWVRKYRVPTFLHPPPNSLPC